MPVSFAYFLDTLIDKVKTFLLIVRLLFMNDALEQFGVLVLPYFIERYELCVLQQFHKHHQSRILLLWSV